MSSERNVISIIKGGLGNQLFIYAAGRAFAERTGARLLLDNIRGYTHDTYGRRFLLDQFPISAGVMPESMRLALSLKSWRHKIVRSVNKLRPVDQRTYLAESHGMDPKTFCSCQPTASRVYLNGNWNDERFFGSYSHIIRKELKLPEPVSQRNVSLGQQLRGSNQTVFIHIRRVRYATKLTSDYYETAISRLVDKLDEPRFVVFSDDLDWARENLPRHLDYIWVDGNADDEMADMWLMTCCQHGITANSGFSWWGAWLGPEINTGRIVYAPDHPGWHMRPAKGWCTLPFDI